MSETATATPDPVRHFYETRERKSAGDFYGVCYHYDPTGNREIIDHKTGFFDSAADADEAVGLWMEANNIDAELA